MKYLRIKTRLLVGLCTLALFACTKTVSTAVPIWGIDVSHYNGDVNWQAVKTAGANFVFIKASEGHETVDPKYASNWQASGKAGLLRGVYHFYDPSVDPAAQAKHFLSVINGTMGELPPVVDIEVLQGQSPASIVSGLSVFITQVEASLNCKLMIYTSPGFWNQLPNNDLSSRALWLADYADTPTLPSGWQAWLFWQFEQTGTVSGVNGSVDKNHFSDDMNALKKLACPS